MSGAERAKGAPQRGAAGREGRASGAADRGGDGVREGIVFDIKEFAVFDGPGIRTTVFMKGCPLRCRWCHNPEGLSAKPQLMVSYASCVHCGACERVCPHPDGCTACGACVPACPRGLRKIAGTRWTSADLAARLRKDGDVYAMTGGGVTFSGGEPLMQWAFVREVIERLEGIPAAVETSGYAPESVFAEAMACCKLILMDWKVADPGLHRKYTGVDQAPILRHARMLAEGDTPFILRLPVIPGVNDCSEHFERAAELVRDAKALVRVDILPYQRAAGAKYGMVGMRYDPGIDEARVPDIDTAPFRRAGIPFQLFR